MKVFLALTAIIGGLTCLVCYIVTLATAFGWASDFILLPIVGALLIAGGATFFRMNRTQYKR
ncbi:MAG: hypothetical protein P4L40_16710 [Terracidiphilus sp.]|nr:hypothetical protein [Terracidiphilus sp.]